MLLIGICLIIFLIIEALKPVAGVQMLAFVFVGGMYSWIMWVLREDKMAVAGLVSTGLLVVYTLLDVIKPISDLIKKAIGS